AARRERQAAAADRAWLDGLRGGATDHGQQPPSLSRPDSPTRDTGYGIRDTKEGSAPNWSLVTRHSSSVKVFPDLALAMLRTKTAAAGRVWLLLRHADAAGRGRVAVDEATRLLTDDGSPLRVCGRRQLANLLRAGEGLYWQRDTDRHGAEWLRPAGAARVA
ncbi:MAG TPA: hypothetical protein PKE20_10975, partial [Promineifilum sp.]|nr:hypothetical protein [Promineifilum sp.]